MEIKESILQAMNKAGKALKAGELVELTGLSREEVDKGLKILKKEELISSPKVCYWEPKK
jgi:DNA-binding transcriptional regulator GbsR (MarR family)